MYVRVKVRKIKVENTKTNRRSVREQRKRTLYRNVRKIKGPLYRGCTVYPKTAEHMALKTSPFCYGLLRIL